MHKDLTVSQRPHCHEREKSDLKKNSDTRCFRVRVLYVGVWAFPVGWGGGEKTTPLDGRQETAPRNPRNRRGVVSAPTGGVGTLPQPYGGGQ